MSDIIIIILLILLNGIFSMSEIALISARKSGLTSDARRGSKSAATALKLAAERAAGKERVASERAGTLKGAYTARAEQVKAGAAKYVAVNGESKLKDIKEALNGTYAATNAQLNAIKIKIAEGRRAVAEEEKLGEEIAKLRGDAEKFKAEAESARLAAGNARAGLCRIESDI